MNSDTDPNMEHLQVELMREAPAWRKLELVAQMNHTVRILIMSGLRHRHPEASSQELNRRLADLILGPDLAASVYGSMSEVEE